MKNYMEIRLGIPITRKIRERLDALSGKLKDEDVSKLKPLSANEHPPSAGDISEESIEKMYKYLSTMDKNLTPEREKELDDILRSKGENI